MNNNINLTTATATPTATATTTTTTATKIPKTLATKENNLLGIPNTSSTATSESGDNLSQCGEGSLDSLELKMWHKSESESVATCSSISMDSSSEEITFEFMRRFVSVLFTDSLAITLELKHQFGQYSRVSILACVCVLLLKVP